jgi:hypothetical protein
VSNIGDIDMAANQRRPCEIHSSNFYKKGWWHAFYRKGEAIYVLFEDESGNTHRYEVSGAYTVKFLDAERQ